MNRKPGISRTSIVFLLVLPSFLIRGQEFYSIADFMKIAGESRMQYDFSLLKDPLGDNADPGKLNFNYYYLEDSAGVKLVKPFGIDAEAAELYDWGWEAVMLEEHDTAIMIFEEVLKLHPRYSPAITGIGYTWHLRNDYQKAKAFYQAAIMLNPIDYVAWWGLARAYDQIGIQDSSLLAACHAWILNRNNAEIIKDIRLIAEKQEGSLNNWNFVPQYRTTATGGKIMVEYQKPWMGYAICMSVWQFENGFDRQRLIRSDLSMYRQRECLSCLVTSMESNDEEARQDPGLSGFKLALQQKMATEFILFEILLPENPDMAYYLDDSRIEKLISYILKTKIEQKKD